MGLLELERSWREQLERRTATSVRADALASRYIARSQRQRFSSGLPHPIYVAAGSGARYWDPDGNEYVDLTAGWNASMLGRGHPAVASAVAESMRTLGAPGGAMNPGPLRDEYAEEICRRFAGAERVLFAPSGSEANALAIRLCRSFTGNELILRIEGGYHGQYDYLLGGGSSTAGVPAAARGGSVDVAFNDPQGALAAIERNGPRLCAVIAEPMMTIPGAVHQRDGFIQSLRTSALEAGVPFILDEVISGFRFGPGGAGEHLAISPPPDLTVLAKMAGGGLPVACVAGDPELVEQPISASNTHAQNEICFAAALAHMRELTPEAFAATAAAGAELRAALRSTGDAAGLDIQVTGDGPCCGLHFTAEEVRDHASARRADDRLWKLMCLGMALEGVGMSTRTFGPTAAFDAADLDKCRAAFERVLAAIALALSDDPDAVRRSVS